jgi:nucleoside-diphosphate-sugar epimerase
MAVNYGRKDFDRVMIFRPHNIYGPDMGWEHVLPQFALRMTRLCEKQPQGVIRFPIQGNGTETRAFNHIDDFVEGLMILADKGEHLGIYNIGTMEEIAIADVAKLMAGYFGRELEIVPGPLQKGGTPRRCPDMTKLAALGYTSRLPLAQGLPGLIDWYRANARLAPPVKD